MNYAITPNGSARTTLSITTLMILALPLVGCGNNLDCSSNETRDLVYQVAAKEFREAFDLPANWTNPALKFSLADIITREKGKNKTICAAKLHITAPTDPANKSLLVPLNPITEKDIDITYQLERTDDGRLVVRLDGV